MTQWTDFQAKLSEYFHSGQQISFWWREDDVSYDCANLRIVLDVLSKYNVPVLCGAIPKLLTPDMILTLKQYTNVSVCQHGLFHQNNYTQGHKCEFDTNESLEQLLIGRDFLRTTFASQFINVYIPPWNNISKSFKDFLLANGYCAVSAWNYSPDRKRPYNFDVDLIDWSKSESFEDESFVIRQILQCFERNDFHIGIVNHHRTISKKGVKFIEKLLAEFSKYPNISWFLPF